MTPPTPLLRRACLGLLLAAAPGCGSTLTDDSYALDVGWDPEFDRLPTENDVDEWIERFENESGEVFANRNEIVQACDIEPGMKIADVGADTGVFTLLFAEATGPRGTVYAVDLKPELISHVAAHAVQEGRHNVIARLCTKKDVNLPENGLDLVFVGEAYRFMDFPEDIMAGIYAALRDEGWLVMVAFVPLPAVTPGAAAAAIEAGKQSLIEEIEAYGFEWFDEADILEESHFLRFRKVPQADEAL